MLLLSYFILLRLATPALRLGVIAGSWLRSEACVLPNGSACITVIRRITLRVQVFLEFFYWLALTFAKAPDPSRGRGEMAMSHPRCARLFFLHSEPSQDAPARRSVFPTGACSSQLYSAKCLFFNGHRHWSRRPQPRASGGDATLRKDTRREL